MKLAVSVVITLAVGIIIAFLLISFITGWDFTKDAETIGREITGRENITEFDTITPAELIERMNILWKECGFKQGPSVNLYVTGTGNLTKEGIFVQQKELNWCDTLQSAIHGCGQREDLNMTTITLPSLVTLECTPDRLNLYAR